MQHGSERWARQSASLCGSRARITLLLILAGSVAIGCKPRHQPASEARRNASTQRTPRKARRTYGKKVIPSALLPEQGPHPDYPTPMAAGTEDLFFLEEPERGPLPQPLEFPAAKGIAWTGYAHCELDYAGIVCGKPERKLGSRWQVGRHGKQVVMAEERAGDRTVRRLLFDYSPKGMLVRITSFDSHGTVAWVRYFDAARGRLSSRYLSGANALRGCGYLRVRVDKQGRVDEATCLQWLGEPMRDLDGVAVTRYQLDPRGLVSEERRFGLEGQPVVGHNGVHAVRYLRDAAGRVVEQRNFDLAEALVRSSAGGCAGARLERDRSGNVTAETCLGTDGKPTADASGVTIQRKRLDARGCVVAVRYYAADSQRASGYRRVHGMDYEVNEHCDELSRTCLSVLEQPLPCGPSEPARYVSVRDPTGQVKAVKHYGVDGKPSGDPWYGVFELRKQTDERGRVVATSCWAASGQPTLCARTGFHAEMMKFDEAGREVERRFLDTGGGPATNLGCSVRRFQYDNYDHLFESRSLDAQGKPFEVLGAATRRDLYDAGHRRFAVLLLDRHGKPAQYSGCYSGVDCPSGKWHAARIVRSPSGSVLRNQYFDARGQLVQTIECGSKRCFS